MKKLSPVPVYAASGFNKRNKDVLLPEKKRCYRLQILVLSCLMLFAIQSNAQGSYFSFKVSYPFFGAPGRLKADLIDAGFNSTATVGFTQHYPFSSKYPSVIIEWGRFINLKRSFSVAGGLQETGIVRGYSTNKGGIRINYSNWVVNPKFNFHMPSLIFGAGPSALLVVYKQPDYQTNEYHHTRLLPGVGLSAETVVKKKKGFRLGLFSALNLHPAFDIELLVVKSNSEVTTFRSKLNPTNLQLGFRFQF